MHMQPIVVRRSSNGGAGTLVCCCEIKPVDNESRTKLNKEKQEKKLTWGPNDTYIWAHASSSYPRPVPVFIHLVVAEWSPSSSSLSSSSCCFPQCVVIGFMHSVHPWSMAGDAPQTIYDMVHWFSLSGHPLLITLKSANTLSQQCMDHFSHKFGIHPPCGISRTWLVMFFKDICYTLQGWHLFSSSLCFTHYWRVGEISRVVVIAQ
jgi:hypothetical protein